MIQLEAIQAKKEAAQYCQNYRKKNKHIEQNRFYITSIQGI